MFLRKRRIISISLILVIVGLAYLLGWSSVLTIKEINYSGAPTKGSELVIKDLANLKIGDQLARVEPRKVSARIMTLPWVEGVELSRDWLSGKVVLEIKARLPIATFNGHLLDSSGATFDLPGGVKTELPAVFAKDAQSGLAAIKLFTKLPSEFSTRTSAFTASSPKNIYFKIFERKRSISVIWGSGDEIALKLKVYKALVALPENSKISKIDLSEPHSPIVK
jgi:cell division septal protein FtsQ